MASAILGNCVVLPEPVSPQTITTWCSASARMISSRRPETGSDSGNSIGGIGVAGAAGRRGPAWRGGRGGRGGREGGAAGALVS
ncbi:hypothetical protein ACFJIX_16580 [Roseateles sp. UC29_93]|uniref:hypothetical protein n=1 Tax=Roseateles sp. UC29_93 TaxID=3350177 RepID=UPI0036700C89